MEEQIRRILTECFDNGTVSKKELERNGVISSVALNNFLIRKENISVRKIDAILKYLKIDLTIK